MEEARSWQWSRSKSCSQRAKAEGQATPAFGCKLQEQQDNSWDVIQMGCPDAELLANNYQKKEAGVQDNWRKVCCNILAGTAQEENRSPPINFDTTEPGKGKEKVLEHEELTSPAVQNNTFLDVVGDLDSEFHADMLRGPSILRRVSAGGTGRGKIRSRSVVRTERGRTNGRQGRVTSGKK